MTLIAWIFLYVAVGLVLAIITYVLDVKINRVLKEWSVGGITVFMVSMTLWPISGIVIVHDFIDVIPRYKEAKLTLANQKTLDARLNARRKMIQTINADLNNDEQLRREEILSGKPVIDIRPDNEQGRCYVCNSVKTPYKAYYDGNRTLINTISNVRAHEECLMADLKD